MSTLIEKLGDRREPRYTACRDNALECSVSIDADDTTSSYVANVIDLSHSGARLKTPQVVSTGQEIRIGFSFVDPELDFSVGATIRWTQHAADGQIAFGCVLADPIDNEMLEELAEAGILERRQDTRIAVSIEAIARQELSELYTVVTVEEYSRGGLRLVSNQKVDLEGRLMITFPTIEKTIIVRPVWQREVSSHFQVGCRLLERSDSAVISSLVHRTEATTNSNSSHKPWIWCGLGAAVTWFILKLFHLA